ncbi:unnamed protein product, partial [Phaeothamnion confervicola]
LGFSPAAGGGNGAQCVPVLIGGGGAAAAAAAAFGGDDDNDLCNIPQAWQSPVLPLFNVFLAVWATLFLEFWKRRQCVLAYRWGTHRAELISRAMRLIRWSVPGPRMVHAGSRRSVLSTARGGSGAAGSSRGKQQSNSGGSAGGASSNGRGGGGGGGNGGAEGSAHAKMAARAAAAAGGSMAWREMLWTLRVMVAACLEVALLGLSVAVMLWFNYAQYHAEEMYGNDSWAEIRVRIGYAVVPLMGNAVHNRWAEILTAWEGHVTPAAAEDMLVVKLCAFNFVNAYSAPIFLAFWERDLDRLREVLTTLLVTRAIIARIVDVSKNQRLSHGLISLALPDVPHSAGRIVLFCFPILQIGKPVLTAMLKEWRQGHRTNEVRKSEMLRAPEVGCREGEVSMPCNEADKRAARERLQGERYLKAIDLSTEYLEQIVQYGYVTMFAVAFPLAPLLALLNNLVEFSTDQRKLMRSRRPPLDLRSGIGAWYNVLVVLGMLAVLTNSCLLSMTAEGQVDEVIPAIVREKFPHTKHVLVGYGAG